MGKRGALVFFFGALCLSQSVLAQRPETADVEALKKLVATDRAYKPASRIEAERRLAVLDKLVGDPAAFEMEVARIIALADNGHTAVFPAQFSTRYPRSPIRLGLFADGLFVVSAPDEHKGLVGRAVIKINGQDWRTIRQSLAAYQGGEQAFRDQFVTFFMETPALLAASGLGAADRLTLTVDGPPSPSEVSIRPTMAPAGSGFAAVAGVAAARLAKRQEVRLPIYLRDPDEPFQRIDLPQLNATYIRMDSVSGLGLKPFLDEALSELGAKRPEHVILDVRFNMGGDLNNARDFAKALPALVRGQIYAITSGRTFSAAISTLGYLKEAAGKQLTIVGEPVGDRLEFWAEGSPQPLPSIGTRVLVATERHNYMTGCPEDDCHGSIKRFPIRVQSLQPDIRTPFTYAALKEGRDPALEAIEADIRARSRRPSAD